MASGQCRRPRVSGVWEFFEEPVLVENDTKEKQVKKILCKLCDQRLADGGGTTNLMSHLRAKHPEEHRRLTDSTDKSARKQTTLTEGMFRKCSAQRAAAITDLIVEFVARDLRPMSVVDGYGFKQLLGYIEPGYKVPSRTHVTSICRKKYEMKEEELLSALHIVPNVALTTDIWTSRATQAYLTVTCHFLTAEWKMESKVVLKREMPERHTGVHIHERLLKASEEWGIKDKVAAVVCDNAANMVLAMEFLEGWADLPCFGYTLQLAVKAGLELSIISRLTGTCRKIVGHFKHSVVAMGALHERQRSLNLPQHSLLQDVTTRWNSTYFMYERLAEQRWVIYAVIHDEQVTQSDQRHLDLKPDQWDLLSQLVVVLKPLQVATTALCKDRNVSSSLILPVVNGLVKCHLKANNGDLVAVKHFKEIVTSELQCSFPFDPESVAVLAAAVDPRYRQLKFFSTEQQEQVYTVLCNEVQTLYEQEHQEYRQSPEEVQEPQVKRKKGEPSAMSFLLGTECNSPSIHSGWTEEIELFQKEPQLHHDEDALVWWKSNAKRFPTIAKLARRFLCVPATSVPSERIFSTAGHVISNQRSSLTPENADMLIFLNRNL